MKWFIVSAVAIATGMVSAYLSSIMRPPTHNIASLFGDLMFGILIAVLVMIAGWLWFMRAAR
jgi:hypothetical protein